MKWVTCAEVRFAESRFNVDMENMQRSAGRCYTIYILSQLGARSETYHMLLLTRPMYALYESVMQMKFSKVSPMLDVSLLGGGVTSASDP